MKRTFKLIAFSAILLMLAGSFFSCGEKDCQCNNEKVCNVENPLTDLLWLKSKVDEITLLFQGNPLHIAISQCIYGDGKTGFLEDRGNIAFFYNCEGETLCIMGGDAGETCSELNIVSKELIWEINK